MLEHPRIPRYRWSDEGGGDNATGADNQQERLASERSPESSETTRQTPDH
jgi:hypothetical protein